jgi:hypothetical protein
MDDADHSSARSTTASAGPVRAPFVMYNVPYFITRISHHTLVENRPAGFQQVAHGVTPHSITADMDGAGNDRGMTQCDVVQIHNGSVPCHGL